MLRVVKPFTLYGCLTVLEGAICYFLSAENGGVSLDNSIKTSKVLCIVPDQLNGAPLQIDISYHCSKYGYGWVREHFHKAYESISAEAAKEMAHGGKFIDGEDYKKIPTKL